MFPVLNIDGFATFFSYLGMAFLVGFWLVKSRTATGFFWTACGVITIYVLQASDRNPVHLVGILVCAVVIAGLMVASWALVRSRSRRTLRARHMAAFARADAWRERANARAKRQATQAEVAVGERQPRQRQATTTAPAQRERTQRQRSRGGYVVNQSRATGLK